MSWAGSLAACRSWISPLTGEPITLNHSLVSASLRARRHQPEKLEPSIPICISAFLMPTFEARPWWRTSTALSTSSGSVRTALRSRSGSRKCRARRSSSGSGSKMSTAAASGKRSRRFDWKRTTTSAASCASSSISPTPQPPPW